MAARTADPARVRECRDSILDCYRRADADVMAIGWSWYPQARDICVTLSLASDIPVDRVAHCIAALSPTTGWAQNLRIAGAVIAAYRSRGLQADFDDIPRGFRPRSKTLLTLALRALEGHEVTGPKIGPFARAILGDRDALVLDRWACRVAGIASDGAVRAQDRRDLTEAYQEASEVLDVPVREVQAVTWVLVRAEQ